MPLITKSTLLIIFAAIAVCLSMILFMEVGITGWSVGGSMAMSSVVFMSWFVIIRRAQRNRA